MEEPPSRPLVSMLSALRREQIRHAGSPQMRHLRHPPPNRQLGGIIQRKDGGMKGSGPPSPPPRHLPPPSAPPRDAKNTSASSLLGSNSCAQLIDIDLVKDSLTNG